VAISIGTPTSGGCLPYLGLLLVFFFLAIWLLCSEWCHIMTVICITLMTSVTKYLFICVIGHLVNLLGKDTVDVFCLGRLIPDSWMSRLI
jgi:hypothetical protein